ncbi:hypothetical protein ACXR0O_26770 [Verrucomicrobiota bacterium sgz303538]
MKRLLLQILALAVAVPGFCAQPTPRPIPLDKANVLPLALDDAFQFRKTRLYLNDPKTQNQTGSNPVIEFERQRINFGAVSQYDRQQRYGNYFTFFWRTERPANLTVRLEYRQENLGSHVQAQEIHYNNARGSMKTDFRVIGDDYNEDGKVTAWRALLIENGKIVALNQSFLWN